MLQRAQAMGLPIDKAPPQYDPQWVAMTMGQANKYQAASEAKDYTLGQGGQRYSGSTNELIAENPEEPGGSVKGLNLGQAYNAILELQAYEDAGEKAPIAVRRRATAATHLLKTPRLVVTPTGSQWMTPGVPTFSDVPPGAQTSQKAQSEAAPASAATAPPAEDQPSLTMAVPKVKRDTKLPLATIGTIVDLLESESTDFWGQNTGAVGTAKRLGGGIARQLGGDVSEKASKLHRHFEILKGQMVSILLNEENKISDQDRARLDSIVGGVTPWNDITELWSGIADMVNFIAEVEERDK